MRAGRGFGPLYLVDEHTENEQRQHQPGGEQDEGGVVAEGRSPPGRHQPAAAGEHHGEGQAGYGIDGGQETGAFGLGGHDFVPVVGRTFGHGGQESVFGRVGLNDAHPRNVVFKHGGDGADGSSGGSIAGLHPGDEMAHGEQGKGERREKKCGQPPFQVKEIAVDADEGDQQSDDGRARIGQKTFQGVHVIDDDGHDVPGLPILEVGEIQRLEMPVQVEPDVVAGALGHGGQGVVRAGLEDGQENERAEDGQAEHEVGPGIVRSPGHGVHHPAGQDQGEQIADPGQGIEHEAD